MIDNQKATQMGIFFLNTIEGFKKSLFLSQNF